MGQVSLAIAALVIAIQLLTLNFPAMNGDEAMYTLILEELRQLLTGHATSLNPVIGYAGPLDFWLLGSVHALTVSFFETGAWMVRIVPLLLYWTGALVLNREISRRSREWAHWHLALAALTPMVLVYSRLAWPHALLLGIFNLMLAESFRFLRTGSFNWLWAAFLAGFSVETHTSGFIGTAITVLPTLPRLLRKLREEKTKAALAVVLFAALAYPVVRNFPPPMEQASEAFRPFAYQARSLLNIASGRNPFLFWLQRDPAPDLALFLLLALIFGAIAVRFHELVKRRALEDRPVLLLWAGHLFSVVVVLWMSRKGRSLETLGNERYVISLTPGWILLQADAFKRLAERFGANATRAGAVACTGLLVFQGWRFLVPILLKFQEPDPTLLAARWLEERCPPDRCVAYAENFWNYWPIRYYTRGTLALNFVTYNWKKVPYHWPEGRTLAGCWYSEPKSFDPAAYSERAVFERSAAGPRQVCFSGIQDAERITRR